MRSAEAIRLALLYAEQIDVRPPFAPLGDHPLRTREDLRRHFAAVPHHMKDVTRFEPVGKVHETTDPELVIYEFSYVGEARGHAFEISCLFVTRVRDGQIVESRDYAHHIAQARREAAVRSEAAWRQRPPRRDQSVGVSSG